MIIIFKNLKDYLYIVAGSLISALGINLFLLPCKISVGGLSGLATVIYYLAGIPLSVTNLAINVLLFFLGFRLLPRMHLLKTLLGIIFLSLFLELTSKIQLKTDDIFVSGIFGGVLTGFGVGLTVSKNASTGGTDFASVMLRKKLPHISVASFMLMIDSVVILISAIAFKNYVIMLYSVVALYITTKVTDFVLIRGDFAKCVYIISASSQKIAEFIHAKMDRGVTGIYSKGLYANNNGMMLMCILKNKEIPDLLNGIKEIDPDSFTIVSDVRQVHGRGFKKVY